MKKNKIIIIHFLITLLAAAFFISCKYDANIYNNTVKENNSIVKENGLLVPDAIDLINNYSGIEIPLLKVVVFNQKDVDALSKAIKNKNLPISLDISTSNIDEIEGFKDCASLKKIILPDTLTIIAKDAFNGCTSLSYIQMPYYLTEIQDNAFLGCQNLNNIEIGDLVKTIGKNIISHNASSSFNFLINMDNNSWKVESESNAISLTYVDYIVHKNEIWTRY